MSMFLLTQCHKECAGAREITAACFKKKPPKMSFKVQPLQDTDLQMFKGHVVPFDDDVK